MWTPPTKEEIEIEVKKIGIAESCKLLGKSRTTIYYYRTGEVKIDKSNWDKLRGKK